MVKAHLPVAAQALRKLRQERRVPLSFRVFVFPLTGGSPAVRAFHVSVAALSFTAHFKAWLQRHCRMWRGCWTHEKCPNRKNVCRSNYQRLKRSREKGRRELESCARRDNAVDPDSSLPLCADCALCVWRLANEWAKKAAVHWGQQKINAWIWSVICCRFHISSALLCQVVCCCSHWTGLHFRVLMLFDPWRWALSLPNVLHSTVSPLFAAFLKVLIYKYFHNDRLHQGAVFAL